VRPYLVKTHHKKGLMEWFKVQSLSSNPRTEKKERKKMWYLYAIEFYSVIRMKFCCLQVNG
jgi:hypothetical protein